MDDNMIMVTSASDSTIVINVPDLALHRSWTKRGSSYPFDRKILTQAFYTPSVEYLFKHGLLTTNDTQFLKDVGIIAEDNTSSVMILTDNLLMRIIKLMPVRELKETLSKLSDIQLSELGEYAIEHYKDLNMDRIDILSKATHKNILKAIENYKAAE